jgi:hypothetical protein
MSLDLYLIEERPTTVFEWNITHNLMDMAREAGVCDMLWSPKEAGIATAEQLIYPLRDAIAAMKADPARFKAHNPENGWGTYDGFLKALGEILAACEESPGASIRVTR